MLPTAKRITTALGSRFILPFFLLGVAGNGAIALAQSPGTFTATGGMTTPRSGHTATLLPDGRVLIAGGTIKAGQGFIPSNTAEIYDPSRGTFAATGNLMSDHVCHEANLLGNGKVLIASGSGLNDRVPYAELYDPDGTFAATGTYATDTSGFNTC